MTCAHAQILVRDGQFRYIAACNCEGGIIHLSWDTATFHLSLVDFRKFKQVVDETKSVYETHYAYTLWVSTIGIALKKEEHKILSHLVDSSLVRLRTLPSLANAATQHRQENTKVIN